MKWGDFGHGRALFEVHIVDFIGQCAMPDLIYRICSNISCYGIAFSMEYRVFLEDSTVQGCGGVFWSKHPVFHRLVVQSAWTAWF
jgi:hypothetical protein